MTTVLHVDDDADLLEIASFYMKAQFPELEVVTALTARHALEVLRTHSIDAIVSDYQMDTIDGLEFLKMVREADEITPFIMLTGKGREEVAIKALNLGATYYLKKEGSPKVLYAELVHLIRNSLRHSRAEKELRASLQALQLSEVRYRTLFENAPAAIILDADGQIIEANEQFCELFGYSLSELLDINSEKLFADSNLRESLLEEIRVDGHITDYELFCRKQDGSTFSAILNGSVVEYPGQQVFFGMIRDLTEQLQMEKTLRLTQLIETRRQLEQSREKYQSVVHSSPYGIFIHRNKRLLYANPAAAKILKEDSPESLSGRDIMDFVPTESRESVDERVTSVYEGKIDSMNLEAKWLGVDDTPIDIELYVTRIMYEGGLATLTMFSDISERKKIERELQESEDKVATILSSIQDLIFIIDEDDVYVDFYGTENSPLYVPPDEFLGKPVSKIMPPDIAELFSTNAERVRATGQRRLIEYPLKMGDVLWFSAAIDLHEDGKHIIVTVRDITELRKTKTALSESRSRLKTLYEYVPYPIVLSDPESLKIIDFNEAAERFFGYSRDDLSTMMLSDIDANEDEQATHEHVRLLVRDGAHSFQTKHLRKDGRIRDVFVSIRLIKIEGSDYIQAVVVDNSEQKAIEESLKRKNLELSEFVHAMAHDIRGSLHNIQGYAHLLQDDYDEETTCRIIETSKRLGSLLERSVILADAGIVADTNQEVDLTRLVESVSASEIPASVCVEIGDLPTVMGDYHKIGQVFSNLLTNAVEHGEAGTITIESRNLPTGTEILISNDGKVIPEDLRDRIFERGFTTKPSGTGLGMSIVKRIVDSHGWRIRLLSADKTTFSILIPI